MLLVLHSWQEIGLTSTLDAVQCLVIPCMILVNDLENQCKELCHMSGSLFRYFDGVYHIHLTSGWMMTYGCYISQK
jgi:hypothetical protein